MSTRVHDVSKIEEAVAQFRNRDDRRERSRAVVPSAHGRSLTGAQGSGAIARMDNPPAWSPVELRSRGLVDFRTNEREAANVLRQLRTGLVQSAGAPNFVAAVTGVVHGSGASFVARNLAAAFAYDATKTAVCIDCDLRDRTVSQLVHGDGYPGLVDYLRGDGISVEEIIRGTGIPRLRVVPAGGTDVVPTHEPFTSPRLQAVLEHMKGRYPDRFILVDVPPITDNADARIVAEACDFTLLVVPYGRTSPGRIRTALQVANECGPVGIVFNDDRAAAL